MFVFRPDKLAAFFRILPRDTAQAAALARDHDERLNNRAWTQIDEARPLRHALEVRHPSFECPEFIQLLREYDIGLVVADTAGKWPFIEDVTADFIYVRLHGGEELYVSGYPDDQLDEWARKIKIWAAGKNPSGTRTLGEPAAPARQGRDAFVYFDNDVKVRAPYDAMSLAHKLGIGPPPSAAPDAATISEVARTIWPSINRRWQLGAKSPTA